MTGLLFALHRFVLMPLGWLVLQSGHLWGDSKWRKLLRLRREGLVRKRELQGRPFWIHAASGEIEYARPIMRALKKAHPDIPIVVTYTSPSSLRILEQDENVDAYGPVPWEMTSSYCRFFAKVNPRALLIARTDAWPVMCSETARAGLPILLFAATFAAKTSRLGPFTRRLTGFTLSKIDEIHVVSEDERDLLKGVVEDSKIHVHGDTRYDQVVHRLENPRFDAKVIRMGSPLLVAGSTWPEDEAKLIPALRAHPSWKALIAPHETDERHLKTLEENLEAACISHQRLSAGSETDRRVVIIDRVGILAELYARADLTFVGGSFRKNVHSVMEPLAAGKRVLVGPFHGNNREALAFRAQIAGTRPAVVVVSDASELAAALADPQSLVGGDSIKSLVHSRRGATDAVLDWCHRATT